MKRLLWILVAAWCTAFAQVQPVAVVSNDVPSCCCDENCDCDSACPMVATVPAHTAPAERPAGTVEVRQVRQKARHSTPRPLVPSVNLSVAPAFAGLTVCAPPDVVPRFCRHCAYLL